MPNVQGYTGETEETWSVRTSLSIFHARETKVRKRTVKEIPVIDNHRVAAEVGARLYRGRSIEAIHYASIAVVDRSSTLTHSLGDSYLITMTRSSIKPFQLMPLIMTGAADHYKFSNEQLAIMSGSHSGTDEHRVVVMSNLERAGNRPEHLKCGTHLPMFMQLDNLYPRDGEDKDSLRHNCSGKHSGFLALARFMGVDPEDYLDQDSKSQKLIKKTISDICEYPQEKMYVGTDGCSAPNYPLPLANLATGFMKLANPDTCPPDLGKALKRVNEAISHAPFMISGLNRLDYNLMSSFHSNIVCKGGAEGLQAIGFSDPPFGIAVKVHGGNARVLGAICVELLKQLGIVRNMGDYPDLYRYEKPEIRNNRDLVTGHVIPDFQMKKSG